MTLSEATILLLILLPLIGFVVSVAIPAWGRRRRRREWGDPRL